MVRTNQPFSTTEDPDFRWLLRLLKPNLVVHSADTIKCEIMKRYQEEGPRIGDRLCNAGSKISVTLDCWTSPNTKAFMGITAHYIDHAWVPHSLVLEFVPLLGHHSGEDLCEAFVATCDRLGLLPKLLGITTDNASNIDNFLVRLEGVCFSRGIAFDKKEQHVRCMAHVTNLGVQALLRRLSGDVEDAELGPDDPPAPSERLSCITRLRHLVVKVRSSPQRRNDFKALCKACGISGKELICDTRTRWNSTYAMIKRASELRTPLSNVGKMSQSGLPDLSDSDWELLEVVAHVLRAFDEASQPLCGATYPTLNGVVPTYNYLLDDLEGFLGMRDNEADGREKSAIIDRCDPDSKSILKEAIQTAHEKIRKYYTDAWAGMYAIAVILDPRYKTCYYEANKWEAEHIAHAKGALLQAVEEYEPAASQPDQVGIATHLPCAEERSFKCLKRLCVQRNSEVERYLAAPMADPEVNVLEWWKHHSDVYPCLARIARDYLAISATSVPAERVFSGGADLITNKRGSLNEDTIQACMCLSSWL
jgi:hypothetical protein